MIQFLRRENATKIPFTSELNSLDAVENYFECITTCSLGDGECVTRCVDQLKESDI